MIKTGFFSFTRWKAIVIKEFLQLRRDRVTFAMVVGLPIIQVILFGYAININPKHLPTALVIGEQSQFSRSLLSAFINSEYFDITTEMDEKSAQRSLKRGEILFVVSVPTDFSRQLLRGERPSILIEADATDPTAINSAVSALQGIIQNVIEKDLKGSLSFLKGQPEAFSIIVHRTYNPEIITQYNIIPKMIGVILTLTTVMMTALSITRERERGTMENLLSSPVTPFEILTGKIVPYILICHIQLAIIVFLAIYLFSVPFLGNSLALYAVTLLFIAANLTIGITISSIANNQLQALQMSIFYFFPNLLLSGFMFPFLGMPQWARMIGNLLPLTYFNRAASGVLLKGNGWNEILSTLWPIALFCIVIMLISIRFFRKTLD